MKPIFTFILIVIMQAIIYGQVTIFTINIEDEQGIAIPAVHLTIDGNEHLISDINGEIRFNSTNSSIDIKVSHISFIQLDTTINIDQSPNHLITLKSGSYSIDPVTISDKQRLFEKSNWAIIDVTHHEYGFLVSAVEKSKKYIYLFDKEGRQILKSRTKFKHISIINGLKTGHYHLMSSRKGKEIMVSTDTIIFLAPAPIEQYEKTLNHFKFTNENYTIAEEWTLHNKKFLLSVIDNKTFKRTPFHVTYDKENYIRSQSVYREIIRLYYRDCSPFEPSSINSGFNKANIITEGTWSGDLFDLIISDTIQEVYNYYISIHDNEISISTEIKNDQLFVLDDLKRTMLIFDLGTEEISPEIKGVPIPKAIVKGKFMSSGHEGELFIVSGDDYFSYDISAGTFVPITFEEKDYYYPKSKFIDNNILYVLAQKSKIKHKKSIYRCGIEREKG